MEGEVQVTLPVPDTIKMFPPLAYNPHSQNTPENDSCLPLQFAKGKLDPDRANMGL